MPQNIPPTPVTVTGTRTTNVAGPNAGLLLKSGRGVVTGITVNTPGTQLTVYDSLTATGTKLSTMSTATVVGFAPLNWSFATGLFVVTTGANSDITVSYQ